MKTKRILLALASLLLCVMVSCGNGQQNQQNTETDSTAMPEIKFDTATFNFGHILQGEQVSYVFKFKNIGNADLIIRKVKTSCGCTVPEYDKTPVRPGEDGAIRVRFDSDGKDGTQYKTVSVYSNCKDEIFDLVVTGTVEVR